MLTITQPKVMIHDSSPLFTVPLTRVAHQEAQKFYRHHKQPQKAKQIYLNSLAVYTVDYYLKCLGFDTNKSEDDSEKNIEQILSNTANLEIDSIGKIECRYVLPNANNCYIPAETWDYRVAYVAVCLNQALTEAQVFGFLETTEWLELNNTETVELSQFQPIENLIDKLIAIGSNTEAEDLSLTCLTNFLNIDNLANKVNDEWQDLRSLLNPQLLGFAVRSSTSISSVDNKQWTEKGQLINLETLEHPLILGFALQPIEETVLNISIELYPSSGEQYLSKGIKMQILDETETSVMEGNTKENSPYLRFYFRGNIGDVFTVKLTIDSFSLIKHFQV